MDIVEATKLLKCFPNSFINHNAEAILEPKKNIYICLADCTDKFDISMKLLEWCSRSASYAIPYRSDVRNKKYRNEIRYGINEYLGTDFSHEDMCLIYEKLGDGVNHGLCNMFICSGFDMNVLIRRGNV